MVAYSTAGATQVCTYVHPPTGSPTQLLRPRWLGTLGHIDALDYSFKFPGGCDKLTCLLQVPATVRTDAMDVGRVVRAFRGGSQVWYGVLDEATPGTAGWTINAVGIGNLGSNVVSYYTPTPAWPSGEPDQAINNAISRGLLWSNPGVGSPSGIWLSQSSDPGSQKITDVLNGVTSRGGLSWYVNSHMGSMGNVLQVANLPTVVDRIIVCTDPVPRTLGGFVNTLFIRYCTHLDDTSSGGTGVATYALQQVTNQPSVAIHGPIEEYLDISNTTAALSAAQATAIGTYILQIYQAISYSGTFSVQPGQLLNVGGQPIDPGKEQCGHYYKLIMTEFGRGGNMFVGGPPTTPAVSPTPGAVQFIGGNYEWDDKARIGKITPYQIISSSMSGLLSLQATLLTPVQPSTSP